MMRYGLCLLLFLISSLTHAESSVWKVTRGQSVMYLAGTIHLLRPDDYPLPAEFERAFQLAETLIFETDINQFQKPEIMQLMLKQLSYSDQRTIASVTSAQTYQALEEYARRGGLSLEFYRKAKPGLLMSTFLAMEMQKIGATAEGIDSYFLNRALKAGKQTRFFETPQQQIHFLARMGEGNEEVFYLHMLQDMGEMPSQLEDMLIAWRNGDSEQLNQLANASLARDYPAMYRYLLVERNAAWLPHIEAYLKSAPVELVLVGAAHLVGENGLVEQLRRKGYRVSKL